MGIRHTVQKHSDNGFDIEGAFQEFYRQKELNGVAKVTLKGYEFTISKFIAFCQEKNYQEINHGVLYDYIQSLRLKTENTTSINHHLRILRVFLYWCMENGYSIKSFKISLLREQELPPKCHSEEELERLLIHPKEDDDFVTWRNWTVVSWILGTGCRCSTVVNIKIGDIDFSNKQVILRHTKNKKPQIIPLSLSLSSVVKEYISLWRNSRDKESLLFPNIGEHPLTAHSLRNGYVKYCKVRGVANTSLHALRHDFARL